MKNKAPPGLFSRRDFVLATAAAVPISAFLARSEAGAALRSASGACPSQPSIGELRADMLRAAQKNPEQYRDLVVRVAGFSEFFIT